MAARRTVSLVRHGEYTPTPEGGTLTLLGKAQAEAAGAVFAQGRVQSMHCSPLRRAIETADRIAHVCGRKRAKRSDDLAEISPTARAGVATAKDARAGQAQVRRLLEALSKPAKRSRHDVLVAHGNLIRALCCAVLEAPPHAWMKMAIDHGSITTLVVTAAGRVHLVGFNATAHLGALVE
ncbi:MAG: histidine phosphatase family protein [Myxococcota bacterium]